VGVDRTLRLDRPRHAHLRARPPIAEQKFDEPAAQSGLLLRLWLSDDDKPRRLSVLHHQGLRKGRAGGNANC
jgi:hypothetical protein